MKIFKTSEPGVPNLRGNDAYFFYNGTDALMTRAVYDEISQEVANDPHARSVYDFERLLLGPVLTMTRRGVRIDDSRRESEGTKLTDRIAKLEESWNDFTTEACGKPVNWRSAQQTKALFYDTLGIAEITRSKKGETKITTDKTALEQISKNYVRGKPFADILLRITDLKKQRDVIQKSLCPDGRWRSAFNVAGTDTGRFSSSRSPFFTASGFQNIDPLLRRIFIPDRGYVFCSIDLKGAESFVVAYRAGCEQYIHDLEHNDIHTLFASVAFGIPNERAAADAILTRRISYRDASKRGQHAGNYLVGDRTLAAGLFCPVSEAAHIKKVYLARYKISPWHEHIAQQLMTHGYIVTPLGRKRHFWSRLQNDSTIRAAVAFEPQSTIADWLNEGMYNIWHQLEPKGLQLLGQIHDACLFQVPDNAEGHKLIAEAHALITHSKEIVDIYGKSRMLKIPADVEVGHNWGKYHANDNSEGLRKWAIAA